MAKNPIRRQALEYVRQAQRVGEGVEFKEFTEKTFHERWKTNKYGGVKLASVAQIGGQTPGFGPDVLKYIKQHDPDNSAGSVKQGLDMMLKLQEATEAPDLFTSIQPLQSILGNNLYSAMQSMANKSKTQKKSDKATNDTKLKTIIDQAMECTESKLPEDATEATKKLDEREVTNIGQALATGQKYKSDKMPSNFVNCINEIITRLRAIA